VQLKRRRNARTAKTQMGASCQLFQAKLFHYALKQNDTHKPVSQAVSFFSAQGEARKVARNARRGIDARGRRASIGSRTEYERGRRQCCQSSSCGVTVSQVFVHAIGQAHFRRVHTTRAYVSANLHAFAAFAATPATRHSPAGTAAEAAAEECMYRSREARTPWSATGRMVDGKAAP